VKHSNYMKYILPLLVSLSVSTAIAQVRIGAEAGINISKYKHGFHDSYYEHTSETKTGLRLGAIADITLGRHFALQPGVFYSVRGGSLRSSSYMGWSERNITVQHLDIPLMLFYNFKAGPGRLMIGVGPQLSIALKARHHQAYAIEDEGLDTTATIEIGQGAYKMDRLDIAASAALAYQLDMGFFLKVGYIRGLRNYAGLDNYLTHSMDLQNRAVTMTIGYIIGRRTE
jgi:hypothetical protein